jgi:hypothetical protein
MLAGIKKAQLAGIYGDAQRRGWQTRVRLGTAVSGAKGKHWKLTHEQRLRRSVTQRQRFQNSLSLAAIHKAERRGIEWKLWREAVFARDNYTCQFCGIRGGVELHPHHIKPFTHFQALRYDVNNGVTLCAECHRTTPSFGVGVRTFLYAS